MWLSYVKTACTFRVPSMAKGVISVSIYLHLQLKFVEAIGYIKGNLKRLEENVMDCHGEPVDITTTNSKVYFTPAYEVHQNLFLRGVLTVD